MLFSRLQLQLAFVIFEEFAKIIRSPQQAVPLFVIKRHRETAESINADTTLLADFKFQPAGSLVADLLFKLRNAGHQFFFCGIVRRIAHDNAEDSEIQSDRPASICGRLVLSVGGTAPILYNQTRNPR